NPDDAAVGDSVASVASSADRPAQAAASPAYARIVINTISTGAPMALVLHRQLSCFLVIVESGLQCSVQHCRAGHLQRPLHLPSTQDITQQPGNQLDLPTLRIDQRKLAQ